MKIIFKYFRKFLLTLESSPSDNFFVKRGTSVRQKLLFVLEFVSRLLKYGFLVFLKIFTKIMLIFTIFPVCKTSLLKICS